VSVPARFRQIVSCHAERIAVSTGGGQWTYAELDARSTALACALVERLDSPGAVVALLCEHSAPLVAGILGVLKAGGIYLALDADEETTSLEAILGNAHARLLVTDQANASQARSLAGDSLEVLVMAEDRAGDSEPSRLREIPPEAGAWLMYTSGSTGVPKGVWQSHRGVVHHTQVYRDLIRLGPEDRLSLLTSCSLAASATPLFAALLNGAALCLFHFRSQGAERLADWIRQQRVTVYQSVPTVFRHLLAVAGVAVLDSLRLIRLGGETVRRSDVEAFRQHCPADCVLMNALSSTETGLMSALMMDRHDTLPEGPVSVGHPVRDAQVQLVDACGEPIETGNEGLIAVRSMYLSQGYWRRPDLTAQAFHADPAHPHVRRFLTGDLGRFRPDGCLEHLGRADQQVKVRGRRVDLGEVEAALLATSLIEEATVVAREGWSGERRLVAYLIPRAARRVTPRLYRHLLSRRLARHMIPDDFVPLSHLPTTRGGKVDYRALPAPPVPGVGRRHRGPVPRDRIEKGLAVLWESVLGVSPIGRCADFFDLGGTSLQSIEILTCIEDRYNLVLSPSILVEHSTIESLAAWIADRAVIPTPHCLVPLSPAATGRPLFLLHTGVGHVAAYGQLARRLPDRPVYALQARGLRAESWPLTSIPAMAQRYLEEIMAVDPTGPYLLAGACMGGLIAFEMAVQLVQKGRPVGLLALLDTDYPAPDGRRLRRTERLASPVRDALRILRWSAIRALGLGRRARWLPAYRKFIQHMHGRARRAYRPAFYPGTLTLLLAAERRYPGEDLRLRLGRCARDLRTIRIPGDRAGMLEPPAVEEVARQLQRCLQATESEGAPAHAC
jgi:amino acid adenylation domain-containing protein